MLLVRTPALPSIRAHGTVVNGRKMVIYDTQMNMLYALAICGLVRRDDLAIFAETMNAGSHDVMDLISAGFVKESSAEVDIRIGGRSRKRVRRVCHITDKGLAFLLEFGGALFPWLECIPKNIVGNANLRGANNRIGKKIADDSLEAVVQHAADKPANAVKIIQKFRKIPGALST